MLDLLRNHRCEIEYLDPAEDITIKSREIAFSQKSIHADTILLNDQQRNKGSILCIGLKEQVLPEGMLREVLYAPDYSHSELFFNLSVSAEDDKSLSPPGMRTLTISFSDSRQDLTGEERMTQIRALIPFLNEFSVFIDDCVPQMPKFLFPENISFKKHRTAERRAIVRRSSLKGVYLLSTEAGTPAQVISAATRFLETIK
jgi:hypothetical protein